MQITEKRAGLDRFLGAFTWALVLAGLAAPFAVAAGLLRLAPVNATATWLTGKPLMAEITGAGPFTTILDGNLRAGVEGFAVAVLLLLAAAAAAYVRESLFPRKA